MKAAVHEKPIVPTSEPAAIESKPAAVEKEMDESLTGLAEYVPEESVVQTENSVVEDNKLVSESSENVGNDTNTTVADESLSGLEEISLPELECTAVGDEVKFTLLTFSLFQFRFKMENGPTTRSYQVQEM